jgi:hypothetical protein
MSARPHPHVGARAFALAGHRIRPLQSGEMNAAALAAASRAARGLRGKPPKGLSGDFIYG